MLLTKIVYYQNSLRRISAKLIDNSVRCVEKTRNLIYIYINKEQFAKNDVLTVSECVGLKKIQSMVAFRLGG